MSLRVSITNFYDMSRVLDGMVHQLTPGSASGQSSLRHCKHRLSTTHLHLCTCTHAPMHPVPASNPGYAPVAPVSYMDRRFSAPFISPPPNCFISSTAFCCYEKEARLVILESSGQTPTNCSIISRATEREKIGRLSPAAKTQKKPPVFPAPVGFQLTELLRRAYQNYFRDAMYLASKLAVNIFAGEYRLFIGFTFFNTKHNYQGVQNSIFACRHSLSEKGIRIDAQGMPRLRPSATDTVCQRKESILTRRVWVGNWEFLVPIIGFAESLIYGVKLAFGHQKFIYTREQNLNHTVNLLLKHSTMTGCSTPRGKHCRKNVKGSSVANTERLKQASKRKHGMASNSSNGYDGYVRCGKEWLKGLVEGSTLESTLESPRGCPDTLEGVKWTMADLAHAFDIKPNRASPWALASFISWKCFENNLGKSTADGAHAAFKKYWDNSQVGLCSLMDFNPSPSRDSEVGNPATASDVMDTLHAASKKHGEEGIRTHSGAMSLSYMEHIFEWSQSVFPISFPLRHATELSLNERQMLHKHLGWHALSATAWTVWTRNFETVKLKWKHFTFGIPHWKLSLVERKNWQNKLNNEPELPSVDMDQHMRNWISFLESHSEDFLFPSVGSNGIVQPGSAMSHDVVQKWIKEFCTGAGIDVTLTHLSTHCFRRGGSQYRFMLASVGKRWTLATIRWWGGWAEGEHRLIRANIGKKRDTLIRYLLDELHYYEEGHGDALRPIQREVNMSFLGEHKDIRPASLLEMKELWSSMERSMGEKIKAEFSHSISGVAAAFHRHGEHTGIQPDNTTTNATNVTPIPLLLSSLSAPSPPPGLCIPAAQKGIPRHERWLTFVHDWENIDESRGLHKPLKDWPTKWKTHPAFAMSYRARKLIAEEYILICRRDTEVFLKKWPMAVNGTTELTLALRDALKEEALLHACGNIDMTYLTLSPVPTNTHGAGPLYHFNATVTSLCHWPPEAEAQPKCSEHAPNHDTDTEMSAAACMLGYYGTLYSSCDSSLQFVNLTLDWLKREWAGKVDFVSVDLNVAGALIMKGKLLFIQWKFEKGEKY
ncbi:hypothetical protein BU17DRAFT_64953 [Hysterangium stoloniferum]|nr:hypothetical protein BU17DRAFT_64953 [Hysterangium stoloniferum]